MRRIFFYMAFAVLFLAASCSSLRKLSGFPDITAELTESIEVRPDGSLPLACKVDIPAEYRSLHTGVLIYTYLQSTDSSRVVRLDTVAVDGAFNSTFNDRMELYQEKLSDSVSVRYVYAPKGENTEVALSRSIPYETWMDKARLELDFVAESYGERSPIGHVSFPVCIPVQATEEVKPVLVFEEFTDTVTLGRCQFRIGSAEIAALDEEFRNAIKAALSREGCVGYTVEIEASCSPDAGEEYNNKLAQERALRLAVLLEEEGLSRDCMKLVPLGINWPMLYAWLHDQGEDALAESLKAEEDAVQRYSLFRSGNSRLWRLSRQELFPLMRYSRAVITVVTLKQTN